MIYTTQAAAELAGGSNFAWYDIAGCEETDFNAFQRVDREAPRIEAILRSMYANGQRRLRLPLFFRRDRPEGSFKITPEGLQPADLEKVAALLSIVRRIGFQEIILGFFPLGESIPTEGPWREDIYQEHLNAIVSVRPILVASGMPYHVDLMNEGLPFPFQTRWVVYMRRLWADYRRAFGSADAIGFSMTEDAGRLETLTSVYGDNLPVVLDVHVYHPEKLAPILAELKRRGLASWPWIIGETYYDDPETVRSLHSIVRGGGIDLLYILQWPNSRDSGCLNVSTLPIEVPRGIVLPDRGD